MTEDQMYEDVKKMLSEIVEIDTEKISGDAKFITDLGMDSMLSLEILARLEKKYQIKIPETRFPEFTTLNKTVAVIKELQPKG